jgi:sporulation protein YlmC with PRC-barrel domain
MSYDEIYFCADILEHELIDSDFQPCGKVDDIEIVAEDGQSMKVHAILAGPGAWGSRLPALVRMISDRIAGTKVVRIPWEEVKSIGSHIQLRSRAADLGLNESQRRLAPFFRRIPGGA